MEVEGEDSSGDGKTQSQASTKIGRNGAGDASDAGTRVRSPLKKKSSKRSGEERGRPPKRKSLRDYHERHDDNLYYKCGRSHSKSRPRYKHEEDNLRSFLRKNVRFRMEDMRRDGRGRGRRRGRGH